MILFDRFRYYLIMPKLAWGKNSIKIINKLISPRDHRLLHCSIVSLLATIYSNLTIEQSNNRLF